MAYAPGFVKRYARMLELDEEEVPEFKRVSGHIETKEDEFKAAKQVHDKLNAPTKHLVGLVF